MTPAIKWVGSIIAGFCIVLIVAFLCWASYAPRRSPPDLRRCTQIEIQFAPLALSYLLHGSKSQGVFTADEVGYLQSLKTLVVTDPEAIKAFARDILSRVSSRGDGGTYIQPNSLRFVCLRNGKPLTAFTFTGGRIVTDHNWGFAYDNGLPSLEGILGPIWSIQLRGRCAHNLATLGLRLVEVSKKQEAYPRPSEWCDAIVAEARAWKHDEGYDPEGDIMYPFMCPGAGAGKCHYAMNPDCRRDSPRDTVLLFETKTGWNQYGGPELFTFDNHHDPAGGHVRLNDGTVQFIRSEDELKQLRWR